MVHWFKPTMNCWVKWRVFQVRPYCITTKSCPCQNLCIWTVSSQSKYRRSLQVFSSRYWWGLKPCSPSFFSAVICVSWSHLSQLGWFCCHHTFILLSSDDSCIFLCTSIWVLREAASFLSIVLRLKGSLRAYQTSFCWKPMHWQN